MAEIRQFTDLNGRILRGELVAVSGGSVTIKREDGQSFTLKAATFSAADQAYFKQAMAGGAAVGAGKKDPPPKITSKDVRDFPFCATMKTVKLNPKQKGMFDELRVTTSDRIRIHGKKKEDSGKVDGKVVYPNGRVRNYLYGAALSIDDHLNRIRAQEVDGEGDNLVEYTYAGAAWQVQIQMPQPNLKLTYKHQTGAPVGDAGDIYSGYDRFDRTQEILWLKNS